VSPVRYELGFYIPEDDILHSDCRENLKSYKEKEGLVKKYERGRRNNGEDGRGVGKKNKENKVKSNKRRKWDR
jgi:hypothetical protein